MNVQDTRNELQNIYCELCKLPLFSNCTEHIKDKIQNIKTTFKTRRILLEDCKVNFKKFQTERSRCQSDILKKAGRLKGCIGYAIDYLSKKHKCKFIHRLIKTDDNEGTSCLSQTL